MVIEYNPTLLLGSKRIEITEVAEFEAEEKKEEPEKNYL
jgi:hypothetical protein